MNMKLKDAASIEAIIQDMTLEEKAEIVTGGSPFGSAKMEKYGIPKALFLDGGTGFNKGQKMMDDAYCFFIEEREKGETPIDKETFNDCMGGITYILNQPEIIQAMTGQESDEEKAALEARGCYPPGMLLGATWNQKVIKKCGHALGKEANAAGIDVLLGTPNVNIHRDPLNGRLFEGYSEDPCLVSKLAPAFVEGIQAEGIVANVKHFAANNQETDRMGVNEHIQERALQEIYFPGFKACVKAGCKTVMSAYNKINGTACAMNRWLLTDVLREDWGFEGFVVSDWGAAYEQVAACNAGNDVVMPGPRQLSPLVNAVKEERLSEEALDSCVRNFLKILLEMPVLKGRRESFDMQESIEAAYDAAKEGITLLKNENTLPLSRNSKVSFWGKCSKRMIDAGVGSASVATSLTTNVYDCTAQKIGAQNVAFEEVYDDTDCIIVTISASGQEGKDRDSMETDDRESLEKAIALAEDKGKKVVVVLNIAGPIAMMDWIDKVDAVLCVFIPGMQGGQAAADILFGCVNPSGKLPLTFPKYYRDCPTYGNFPGENKEVWYGEGLYVGYRYYDAKNIKPLFPFGYGLSYTSFEITATEMEKEVNVEEQDVKIRVHIKNVGDMAGSEVIQVYVHDIQSTLMKPVKELKGFQKVFLEAGEEKTIEIAITKENLASYDCACSSWTTEPGAYEFLVGTSSEDIRFKTVVFVKCTNPYALGMRSTLQEIILNQAAMTIVNEAIHMNMMELVGTAVIFKPGVAFGEIWEEYIVPALQQTEQKCEEIRDEIVLKFSEL